MAARGFGPRLSHRLLYRGVDSVGVPYAYPKTSFFFSTTLGGWL